VRWKAEETAHTTKLLLVAGTRRDKLAAGSGVLRGIGSKGQASESLREHVFVDIIGN
jgi:hypothetical protein